MHKRFAPLFALLAGLLAPAAALAQATLLQAGPTTSGHVPAYATSGAGAQPAVIDSGPAGGGGQGLGLSELLLIARGTGAAPFAGQGTGPLGTLGCMYDAPTTNTTGYHYLCFSPNAQGGGLVAYGAGGIAATLPLSFNINGTAYQFPFTTTGVIGPGSSTVADVACWNNTAGTLLSDCGAKVNGPGASTAGHVACWNNTLGTLLSDCGTAVSVAGNNAWTGTNSWSNTSNFTGTFQISGAAQTFPASGALVGTSDTQSLTNKSINASEINSGTLACGQMPALTGGVTSSAGSCTTTAAVGFGLSNSAGIAISSVAPPYGFDAPVNLGLSASASASALTINLTTAGGFTPTSANPVLIPFRSGTLATGTPIWAPVTGALSVVVPSTATLGTSSSNVPFRVWILAAYNGGTPELAVATCSTTTTIYPCSAWESTRVTTTTIAGGSNTAGTPYATTGVANDAVRIIGFCDYSAGLATAGTWASACTTLQLFGPGTPRPGAVVQTVTNSTTTAGTVTNAAFTVLTNTQSQAITPTATPNLIRVVANGTMSGGTGGGGIVYFLQIARGGSLIGNPIAVSSVSASALTQDAPASFLIYDAPGSVSAQTYNFQGKSSSSTVTYPATNTGAILELSEIMG